MQKNLSDIEQKNKEEEEAFKQQLLEEAAKRQQRDWYVPVPGDIMDELFAQHVNTSVHQVAIQRLGDGMYMYGSKKIFAKIMNDKLVIRLNGGFMLIEEFLKNFSEGESKLQLL